MINNLIENNCKNLLRDYLKDQSEDYISKQIIFLFEINGGFLDRFNFFNKYLDQNTKDNLLVSGSAVGSELIQAINFGFKNIIGTEVDDIYIKISNQRLSEYKNIKTIFYDGKNLPFKDNEFTAIMSSHIIEHTGNPSLYLMEHFRCLSSGGLMYIEFPDRNNFIELHTNTISFERFPLKLRNFFLTIMSKNLFIKKSQRMKYSLVKETLLPISVKDIKKWLSLNRIAYKIIGKQVPARGVIRLIVKKL